MSSNKKILTTYVQTDTQTSALYNTDFPLSYKDWFKINSSILPGEEFKQYNTYLTNFYIEKKEQNFNYNLEIRKNYINLIQQLQVFFTNNETEEWYKYVNLDNEKELLVAIPYFARKLKDIALYYINLREEVKKSKIKYNIVGTNTGIVQQLQEQLLTTFTKNNNQVINVPSKIWSNIPQLSSIKDTLTITVEELYDDNQYHDQTASLPISSYYNFNEQDFINYFATKGTPLSSNTWLYSQGTFGLTENNLIDTLFFAENLLTKYISENKYLLTTTTEVSTKIDNYNISIAAGNNVFYWPYGFYKPDMSTITRYEPISLSSTGIDVLGTGGDSILNSDTIFVTTARGIEGAWLNFKEFEEYTASLKAYIEGGKKTSFRFPFPGFGLSGEDVPWSGPSLEFTPGYSYLRPDIKQNVTEAYWNDNTNLQGAKSILIHDTALIEQGAYASERYPLADKIRIGSYAPLYKDSNYNGDMQEVWLYKMTKTDIPVGKDFNLIVWPYERIDSNQSFPTYYPEDISTVCQPIALTGIPLPFSTSSDTIENSDVIYKLAYYQDTPQNALECAWLSGQTTDYTQISSSYNFGADLNNFYKESTYNQSRIISQPGLNVFFESGTLTKFVWEGPDFTDINEVFKTLKHQPDCSYLTKNGKYTKPELCTCKQTIFTPFGHPGANYDDYTYLADFIVEGNGFADLETWRDFNGTTYTSSSAFGWYKTDNNIIGWGYGSWYAKGSPFVFNNFNNQSITARNSTFYLRQGRHYTYYRGGPSNTTAPNLTIRYPYSNNKTRWVKAIQNNNGEWVNTNTISDMVIRPGDVILYKKAQEVFFNTLSTGSTTTQIAVQENRGSIWSDFDYLTIGRNINNNTPQTVNISYPSIFYSTTLNTTGSQYPGVPFGNILTIDWTLTSPEGTSTVFQDTNRISFAPGVPGIYTISFTAITAANVTPFRTYTPSESGFYTFNFIPSITAITPQVSSTAFILSAEVTPVNGFTINCPLYGWDYEINRPASNVKGVKPYWAASSTLYKDINSWGAAFRLVDESNIITQPVLADVSLNTGNYFEYNRTYSKSFIWAQPITYRNYVYKNSWLSLDINTDYISNFEGVLNNLTNQLVVTPLTTLSPITLKNDIDNQPVEVFYKAQNTFNWTVCAIPTLQTYNTPTSNLTLAAIADTPWNNLTNRFYPSIAAIPALDNLYSENDTGGYFTSNRLGASTYINNNFTTSLQTTSTNLNNLYNNSNYNIGGRGLSKIDQTTPFKSIIDNNLWLKEPVVSGQSAGTIKKNVAKKYQKFIPYQSGIETTSNLQTGLILPQSRQTPWGGSNDSFWSDLANKPETYTGILNVSAWVQSQILKQNSKALDYWASDIFGNQYGLYKNLNNVPVWSRKLNFGELWVRKNSQKVSPASTALSGVFDTYITLPLYTQLTGNGIYKIDTFFDTLYIETSGCILLESINYNFETDNISSISDNARALSLAIPVRTSLNREFSGTSLSNSTFAKPGDTWFFPEEKNVIISVCGLSGRYLYPELYRYNIETKDLDRAFPGLSSDITFINSLTANNFTSFESPVLSYDIYKKEFVLSVLCRNSLNQNTITELTIINVPDMYLDKITLYTSNTSPVSSLLPPVINQNLTTSVANNTTGNLQVIALNNPTYFSVIDPRFGWASVTNTGLFSYKPPAAGSYFVPFVVGNNNGQTYYSLNITAT